MPLCVFILLGYFVAIQAQFPWDSCPDDTAITTCQVTSRNCWTDYNCPRGMRCCPSGCGRICKPPNRCRVSPFGSRRFCVHNGMCIRAREEYCCNFRCYEPFASIG